MVAYRADNRARTPDWHNAPVASFGDPTASVLIVGLAPGLSGANRTGRPFTGDYAGELLYETLLDFGFAHGSYERRADDGLVLRDCLITNAVRCVPPANKPLPTEISACRTFLDATIRDLKQLSAIVALGRIAHDSVARALAMRLVEVPFGHGRLHAIQRAGSAPLALFDSYHCSRYNTNTGVLTREMFRQVFSNVRSHIDRQPHFLLSASIR